MNLNSGAVTYHRSTPKAINSVERDTLYHAKLQCSATKLILHLTRLGLLNRM